MPLLHHIVRAINQRSPQDKALRILAGDPELDFRHFGARYVRYESDGSFKQPICNFADPRTRADQSYLAGRLDLSKFLPPPNIIDQGLQFLTMTFPLRCGSRKNYLMLSCTWDPGPKIMGKSSGGQSVLDSDYMNERRRAIGSARITPGYRCSA